MKYLVLPLCFFAALLPLIADGAGSPLEFRPQKFDVLHYDVALDLTKAPSLSMRGVCTTILRWLDSADVVYRFHLRGLTIDSATLDGRRVTAVFVGESLNITSHYEITPTIKPKAGDSAQLFLYYGGTMTSEPGASAWGGVLSQSGTLYAMGVGIYAPYISTTQHWLPCYDHPSDKATFRGVFRVPRDYVVASNGVLTQQVTGDTALFEWTHAIPCATYLLTFAVDKFLPLDFVSSVPTVVYTRASDSASTRTSFSRLPEMIDCFGQHFVPYPFEKVGYVNTPTGAMEHQTMISFPVSVSRVKNPINPIAAHELGHQWFGDLVSPLDYRHAWLTESFATFCESIWMECAGVSGGYLKEQSNKLARYLNVIAKSEGVLPLYDFPRKAPSSNYPETIYQKGAVVVGMLRYELGDSVFFTGIREYMTRHKFSSIETNDLRLVFEQTSGKDLTWFFRQWVEQPGWPILSADTATIWAGNGLRSIQLRLRQTQSAVYGSYVNVPVELGFRKRAGGDFVYRMVKLTDSQQTFTLDSLPDFTAMTINEGPSVRALLQISRITDVEERRAASPLRVSPNPFSGTVTAIFSTSSTEAIITVIAPDGKTAFSGRFDTDSGENYIALPLQHLPNGTYFIRVETGGDKFSMPVILQR